MRWSTDLSSNNATRFTNSCWRLCARHASRTAAAALAISAIVATSISALPPIVVQRWLVAAPFGRANTFDTRKIGRLSLFARLLLALFGRIQPRCQQ